MELIVARTVERKFASEIVVNWLQENQMKNVREIYNSILQGIVSNIPEGSERNEYLDALLAFSGGCGELVKMIIREESTGISQNKEKAVFKINSSRDKINLFCKNKEIMPLPQKPAETIAFDMVDEYRPR